MAIMKEALYHGTQTNWAYAYDTETIHVRVRAQRNNVKLVEVISGDKYDWEKTVKQMPMLLVASDTLFDYWEATLKPKYRRVSYYFKMNNDDEVLWLSENAITNDEPTPTGGFFDFPFIHAIDVFQPPAWAKEAVFYQIMPDRFANGNPANDPDNVVPWGEKPTYTSVFGGDLQGVMEHLDDLVHLGINAIYFTPLFTSPTYHKYDTINYKEVDPRLGDNTQLKHLVAACHSKGIRVMLDAVFNHCGEQFPPFQDVLKHGEQSRYKDWFHIHEFPLAVKDGIPTYSTFGFYSNMPKLNTAHPDVKAYLLDVAQYWIKEIDLDGWRLDVANEIDHQFWREFRLAIKNAKPDAYIVGEVWNDSVVWLLGDQFDSVMNYPFSGKVLEFFAGSHMDGYHFASSMGSLLMRYPHQENEVVFNLLSSHDTPRALTQCGGDKRRLKLCVTFMMTYIGTPCIYYGDEIGLTGGDDPDCRKCMEWDPAKRDQELFDFYRMIIALRKQFSTLRQGHFRFLHTEKNDRRIIYERIDDNHHFMIWMNNHDHPTELSHPMQTNDWRDALTGEPVPASDGQMRIHLDPYGYRIIYRHTSGI